MFKHHFIALPFLFVFLFSLMACARVAPLSCDNGWELTGDFVPVESDYARHSFVKIRVLADKKHTFIHRFDRSFLAAVKLEGWGKTDDGWYLGYYARKWHKSAQPLNAKGGALTLSTIAADISKIPFGRNVYIPTLNINIKQPFTVGDVGQAIKGKRIDIYTGEGKAAQLLTYKVTNSHQVCW